MRKRILFLNYEYPPLGGGAANATKYLLEQYTTLKDIEVDLVTSAHGNKSFVESLSENVRIHYVNIGKNEKNLHHQTGGDLVKYSVKGFLVAASLLRKNKYDVIHAFFGVPCGFMALILGKIFTVPYLVSLRGSDVPGYSERFRKLYPFLRSVIRLVWGQALYVVANSQGLKELGLQTNNKQDIRIIPNGVDTKHFVPSHDVTPGQSKIIITTGATRVTARKGIRYLLEAVAILHKEYPELSVEIMGDGSEKAKLEELVQARGIQESVTFLGRIPALETARFYARADIFVLPSFNEGMSNALLEALASGLPAVVTDTGGSHELVTNGINGLYIEMKSVESLVSALRTLLENPDLRKAYGKESRRKAEALGWDKVAKEYHALYTAV